MKHRLNKSTGQLSFSVLASVQKQIKRDPQGQTSTFIRVQTSKNLVESGVKGPAWQEVSTEIRGLERLPSKPHNQSVTRRIYFMYPYGNILHITSWDCDTSPP